MIQNIIAITIVALVVIFGILSFRKANKSKGCSCCSSNKIGKKLEKKANPHCKH